MRWKEILILMTRTENALCLHIEVIAAAHAPKLISIIKRLYEVSRTDKCAHESAAFLFKLFVSLLI